MEFKINKKYKLIKNIHLASGIKYLFNKKEEFPYINIFRSLTEFQITKVEETLCINYYAYLKLNNKEVKYKNLKYKDHLEYLYFLFFISKIYGDEESFYLFKDYEI